MIREYLSKTFLFVFGGTKVKNLFMSVMEYAFGQYII
jgi:hypothetical protein